MFEQVLHVNRKLQESFSMDAKVSSSPSEKNEHKPLYICFFSIYGN